MTWRSMDVHVVKCCVMQRTAGRCGMEGALDYIFYIYFHTDQVISLSLNKFRHD